MDRRSLLERFSKTLDQLLQEGGVREIIFSEGTYQVEVRVKNHSFWPLIQMDDEGVLQDLLCSCEADGGCVHAAAALVSIYRHHKAPLHVRFRASFWNQLFGLVAKRHGFEIDLLQKIEADAYEILSKTGKRLFYLHARDGKSKKKIREWIEEKVVETEENSIKFSNLSLEDLALWREGKAPFHLLYELSFWSDIAKYFFLEQDKEASYEIAFEGQELPFLVKILFPSIETEVYIAQAYWPSLIPALHTVKSPLQVYEGEVSSLEKILYHEESRSFSIHVKQGKAPSQYVEEGIDLGSWIYRPGKGFYHRQEDPLLTRSQIPFEQIPEVLAQFRSSFESKLEGVKIDFEPHQPRYQLFFDRGANLHIRPYLFNPTDLESSLSWYQHPWVYIDKRGFYKVKEALVDEQLIPRELVADFIDQRRIWLHDFEGFQTHFGKLGAELSYTVLEEGSLRFGSQLTDADGFRDALDFGRWVFVPKRGFFHKEEKGYAIYPNLTIARSDVVNFIERHRDELEQIPGFFTEENPVESIGLKISLTNNERIRITPEVEYKAGFNPSALSWYDGYVYAKGRGFCKLDPEKRFPSRYEKEVILSKKDENLFLSFELEGLKPFILSIDQRLRSPTHLKLAVEKIAKEQPNRYLVRLTYHSTVGSIDAADVYKVINSGKRFLFSKAGLLDLHDAKFSWMRKLKTPLTSPYFLFTALEWIRLTLFEQLEAPNEGGELFNELMNFKIEETIDLSLLKSELRPYQHEGIKWLWFLYCHHLSGLLCDEMGLGKTHQAMALLAAAYKAAKEAPYLVVCPTSVVYHWEALLNKFMPDLKVHVFYGPDRSLEGFIGKQDLLLTSYGILRSDYALFDKVFFDIAIFDELQVAKNEHSQIHQALKQIQAKMRLGLTGTPIENRLRELKSIFDIVLPGYLPDDKEFKTLFILPIEKFQDEERKKALNRLVSLFILRRRKKEVLLDLPEKIEEVIYCDLSSEQRSLYSSTLEQRRDQLLDDLNNQDKPVPYIHIFALITELKRICDHPSLSLGDIEQFHKHASGKWDLFVELLQETRDSGQKVVIFSQYLEMLQMIEIYLKSQGIGFATIKGSTRNRQEEINRFREDPACEVFTASLLAAGVGIDLTCASVVIHYDRWWNPAKENQATDRVHRIGQNRGVQVFKLVSKGTIEENIHRLIEKKQRLIEEMMGKEDTDQISALSREELVELLQKTGW